MRSFRPPARSKSSLKDGPPWKNLGRRVCARRHRGGRGAGLRAPTGIAIPIAPLQAHRGLPKVHPKAAAEE
jgi:hypothetical protein